MSIATALGTIVVYRVSSFWSQPGTNATEPVVKAVEAWPPVSGRRPQTHPFFVIGGLGCTPVSHGANAR